jgi:hypothetical protein
MTVIDYSRPGAKISSSLTPISALTRTPSMY